jgi:hypothetical protein
LTLARILRRERPWLLAEPYQAASLADPALRRRALDQHAAVIAACFGPISHQALVLRDGLRTPAAGDTAKNP